MLKISKFVILHWLKKLKNSSEYGYDAKLAQKKHDIRSRWKNHFKLKSEIYKFKEFEEKFLKIYNAKEMTVERTVEFIKRNYNIKCPSIKTIYNWINSKNWKINRKNLLRSNYVFGGKRQKSVQERLVRKRWVRPFKIGLRKKMATGKRI
ncbi:hypothetical protein ABC565_00295 [Mycoplasmopsis synoviae]|uniref:Transposase n=1 Tax=Mycoplasmopsis synoviae TaxID=2109 RepID=A0AAX3EZ49_MYCSY|nr:hypothetical protein [Mycoplasmopsis synoviae]QGL45474.1 hypothetical protein EJ916_03390 [Mycoplasmopsis synoviae]QXV99315.1 hypothetical protein KXD88_02575 [Mycoplasmopsis synoviae]ULL02267.1 hypothetical protein JM201_02655 [Mycoplasmopsis synoviae]UZW63612.1 hypothetical protein OIE45_02690 [Mycoplasmopsis synoviae]UZW64275.1 hypothetical protein OIE46_02760 [Mycoplasmopsis synoviae]